ncbi:hypothetical protein HK405_006038 [Cladochytrium tenue]|nr:hypothetical protein HK405_006038 [Cladochytrium tenue]
MATLRPTAASASGDGAPDAAALVPPAEPVPFVPWPGWSYSFTAVALAVRSSFHASVRNLSIMRFGNGLVIPPTPAAVHITLTTIPRRDDVLLENMTPADAQGSFPAEWLDFGGGGAAAASGGRRRGVVLYIHGGGYFSLSARFYRTLTWRLSKYVGTKVLAIDYRLAPESVFPLPLHDVISSYLYLTASTDSGGAGYDPSEVFVIGDSAGGGLLFALLLWLRDNSARGFGLPAGACGISPWMDLTQSMPSTRVNGPYDILPYKLIDAAHSAPGRSQYYADDSQLTHPLVSPLFAREDPARPLPPLLVQAGDCERFRDEILLAVRDRFATSPVRLQLYEGMVHDFQLFAPVLPIGEFAMQRIGEFARACLDPAAAGQAAFERRLTFVELAGAGSKETDLTHEDIDEILRKSREKLVAISKPPKKALRSRL